MTAAPYTPDMAVRTHFSGDAAIIVVSGELDICTEPALRRTLTEVLDQRPERLVFDLADVTFIDCASARVLADAGRALPGSRKAVIRRPSRAVRRVLELTGMSACLWIEYSAPGRHLAPPQREHAQSGQAFG